MKCIVIIAVLLTAASAHAQVSFPPDPQWTAFRCDRNPMNDGFNDEPGATAERDVVGSLDAPAGMRVIDANFLYLRLRLDQDPAPGGTLRTGAWGFEFDIDNNPMTYEVLVLVDGTAAGQGNVAVLRNTMTTTPNAPSDPAEMQVQLFPFAMNARSITATNSQFGGGADFWLEFAVPWSTLMPLGLSPQTPIRVWAASSSMNDRLDGDFACHDGASGEPTLDGVASDPTVSDPNIDTDGDGFSDADEIDAGTDPNDPNSVPQTSRLEGGGGCSTSEPQWLAFALIGLLLAGARRGRGSRPSRWR